MRFLPIGSTLQSFDDLIEGQEDQLFSVINHSPQHLLHHLLPPPSVASQNYELRHRTHNRSLPDRAGYLSDANFQANSIFYHLSFLLFRELQ